MYDDGEIRETQKSIFDKFFQDSSKNGNDINTYNVRIDGGMLSNRVKWQFYNKFSSIFYSYVKYLIRHYDDNWWWLWNGGSSKVAEKKRRALKKFSFSYAFEEDMQLKLRKRNFLQMKIIKLDLPPS